MISVDASARLLPRRAWEKRAGRVMQVALVVALLLHGLLAVGLMALPRGMLWPAPPAHPAPPPRLASIELVQNAMPSTGDAPAGGSGKTLEHTDRNQPGRPAAPPPAPRPNAAHLAESHTGTVAAGSPGPTAEARAAVRPPATASPSERMEIRLNDFGDDDGQSGGDAKTPGEPDPRAHNHLPPYPAEAALRGEGGTVHALVLVMPDGHAGAVSIVQSSGWPVLDRAVERTLMHWRFRPAVQGGRKVASEVPVAMDFTN